MGKGTRNSHPFHLLDLSLSPPRPTALFHAPTFVWNWLLVHQWHRQSLSPQASGLKPGLNPGVSLSLCKAGGSTSKNRVPILALPGSHWVRFFWRPTQWKAAHWQLEQGNSHLGKWPLKRHDAAVTQHPKLASAQLFLEGRSIKRWQADDPRIEGSAARLPWVASAG